MDLLKKIELVEKCLRMKTGATIDAHCYSKMLIKAIDIIEGVGLKNDACTIQSKYL